MSSHSKPILPEDVKQQFNEKFVNGVVRDFGTSITIEYQDVWRTIKDPGYEDRQVRPSDVIEFLANELAQAHQSGIEQGRLERNKEIIGMLYDMEQPESPDIECDDPNCECNQEDRPDYELNKVKNDVRWEIVEALSTSTK